MNNINDHNDRVVDISLSKPPESLIVLSELLARNVHEIWFTGRITDGWTWGEVRDDVNKTHPCLVPYEQLSEEEKDYDRRTSQATIDFILSQGYEIIKK